MEITLTKQCRDQQYTSVPIPNNARYCTAGQPILPSPITNSRAFCSFFYATSPKSGKVILASISFKVIIHVLVLH
ncbi:hypothetical protein [Sphingobacterium chungjuense]|nr:hypothetical protein [Sphingobacterium chungjuense]